MTLCEFKEAIRRATGSQKHVDSLMSEIDYLCTLNLVEMCASPSRMLNDVV